MTEHQQQALARAIQFLYSEAEKNEANPLHSTQTQNIGWGMRKATEHIEFVLANYDILHIHKLETHEAEQD